MGIIYKLGNCKK